MCLLMLCFSCSLDCCCVTQSNLLVRLYRGNRSFLWGCLHTTATGIETVPHLGLGIEVFSPFDIFVKIHRKGNSSKGEDYYFMKLTSLCLLVFISNLI